MQMHQPLIRLFKALKFKEIFHISKTICMCVYIYIKLIMNLAILSNVSIA